MRGYVLLFCRPTFDSVALFMVFYYRVIDTNQVDLLPQHLINQCDVEYTNR